MQIKERKKWAGKIAEYIIENGPISLEVLESRAQKHAWYSWNEFDAILLLLKKNPQISATLTKEGVIYKKKKEFISPLIAERANRDAKLREMYPWDELGKSPFLMCMCLFFRNEEGEVWGKGDTHRTHCDALRFPEEFARQNIMYGIKRE